MVAAFAGVVLVGNDETDAEETPSYSVAYIVGDRTYTVPSDTATVKLKTIDELGASASIPEHKTFVQWYALDGETKTCYEAGSTLILTAGTNTIYAELKDTVYTATFKDRSGAVIGEPVTGTYDSVSLAAKAPKAPAIDGMIFAGWLADGADKTVQTKDLGMLVADVAYTAIYTVDYKITFIDGDKTYYTCVSKLTVPDLGDRTGFTFLGWFIESAEGPVQVADPANYKYTADTTLTAKWEPMNVYVTFIAGAYETTVAVLYGQTVVVPELPEGFVAWDFDFSTPITEDITVNAIAATPAEPTGMSDPVVMTLVIIVGALALAGVAGFVVLLRKGKIVIGRGPNAKKPEEPKE